NQFQAAGGMAFLIRSLREAGLLHEEVNTIMGRGLEAYTRQPVLRDGALSWEDGPRVSADASVLRAADAPFSPDGGLKLLRGNLGRAVIKVSAVAPEHRVVEAPARIFETQAALLEAFGRGELDRDMVAVLRFQGPRANGLPELPQLTTALSVLQSRGDAVARGTSSGMSGGLGKGRGPRQDLRDTGGAARGFRPRRTGSGHGGGAALPGAARQRHARTASADARIVRAPVQGVPGGAGHRRQDVGRFGQGACRDPRH